MQMTATPIKGSPREHVYETLRYNIMHLDLKPGTKMSEKDMADTFKVSRTPVREAFVRLAQEELLDIYPQRGTFVSKINLDHLEEARFVREHLEKAVFAQAGAGLPAAALQELRTNLAAQEICREAADYQKMLNLDNDFHRIIYHACGKQRTWELIQNLGVHFYRLRILRLAHDVQWDAILAQHHSIYEALQVGDGEKAVHVAEHHLRLVTVEKAQLLAEYPDYFI